MVDAHTSIVLYGIHSSWVFRIVITGSSTSNVSVDTVIHEAFCLFGGGVTTFEDGGSGDSRGCRVEIYIVCRICRFIPCVRGE